MKRKIAIGADHAGYKLKVELIIFLKKRDYEVVDFGCSSEDSMRSEYSSFGMNL